MSSSRKEPRDARQDSTAVANASTALGSASQIQLPAPPTTSNLPLQPVGTRVWLRLAIGIMAVWWICLIATALFTANPQVISEPQVAEADAVVIATVSATDPDSVTVERVLKGKLKLGDAKVRNLHDVSQVEPGRTYVLPLTRFGGEYRVTTLQSQESPPMIYSATPQTVDRVKKLVR